MSNKKFTVLALFTTIMIDALGWGIAFPVLAPIILNNSAHMLSIGSSLASRNFLYELSLGIYCLFMFFMSPILGSLSDKYGRKKVLILSMAGNSLGFLISGLAIPMHSLIGILIGRSVAGATAGSLPIAQAAMIDISEDSQKASRLGLVVLANVSGFAIGPVIGGFFMDQNIFSHISYQIPFFVSCGMALAGVLMLMLCFKETFVGNPQLKINVFTSLSNLYKAFTHKTTLIYCSVLSCFLFGWAMFFSTMPVFLTERLGWQGSLIGYFITYIGTVFGIIVIGVLPKVTNRFPLPKIIVIALSTLFICALLFPSIHNSVSPWIVILLTIAVPFTYVSIVTLLSMQVDSQKQGEIMGVTGSIFAFTWGVGPIFAGFALRASLVIPYILIGIFFLIAIILFSRQKATAR
jgi:MFS family permease